MTWRATGGGAPSILSPKIAPPITPAAVANARPEPPPMLLPMAPPAMAPMTAPAPDLGEEVMTCVSPHTCLGTLTCVTTGMLDSTRAISCDCAFALLENPLNIAKVRLANVRGRDWIVMWPPVKGELVSHSNIAEEIVFERVHYIWKQ